LRLSLRVIGNLLRESSLTKQLLKGPTFQALASGGVHSPWWDTALRGGGMQSYQHQAARPVSEVSHILMCGDRQEALRKAIPLRPVPYSPPHASSRIVRSAASCHNYQALAT